MLEPCSSYFKSFMLNGKKIFFTRFSKQKYMMKNTNIIQKMFIYVKYILLLFELQQIFIKKISVVDSASIDLIKILIRFSVT